jgi:hypothetical protein
MPTRCFSGLSTVTGTMPCKRSGHQLRQPAIGSSHPIVTSTMPLQRSSHQLR